MANAEPSSRSSLTLVMLLLIAVVVVAAYFRFSGLDWDESQHQHPDERFLTMVETSIFPIGTPAERLGPPPTAARMVGRELLRDCQEWGGYFDTACSPLNPVNRGHGYYVYGTLPLFLVRYVGEILHQTGYGEIYLVGRMLSGLADILTLLLLFAIARQLYDERVALVAAALYAAATLPIQQSHFFTVDNFATLFVVATFYFIVQAQNKGGWRDFALAGVMLGAAVACKISVWPLAGIVALAAILGARRAPETMLLKLGLAALMALLAFRVFQPYAFSGPNFWNVSLDPGWRETMQSIQRLASGEQDAPFAHQWTDRAPVVFPWVTMVVWGLGLPLGLTAWASWAWVGAQIARKQNWQAHVLAWLWATAFFLYQSTLWGKSLRYLLPVYPFFVMFAAYGVTQWKVKSGKWKVPFAFNLLLSTLLLLTSLAWAWGLTRIYTQPYTRIAASRWIYQSVPTLATLRYQTTQGEQVLQLVAPNEVTFDQNVPWGIPFQVTEPATLASVTMNHLLDPTRDVEVETFRVSIGQDQFGQNPLAQAELSAHLEQAPESGGSYVFQFPPITLTPHQQYYVVGQTIKGGPIIARSSAIANEHWDDGIPLAVDGRHAGIYRGVELQNYAEDEEIKRARIVEWLTQADYINLTSNRLYGSIPRLPTRFPLTTEFYRALFLGELGFEKAAEFTSYITLGPLMFPDQESTEKLGIPNPFDRKAGLISIFLPPAEEAFSVYDHPRVVIYRKTPDFSPNKVYQVLSKVDLSQTVKMIPKQATAAPTALMLDPDVWEKQQESGTWSQLYDRASVLNRYPVLGIGAWWLVITLLGLLAWPLIAYAWPGLPDNGWGLARMLGLLVVGYLSWLAASLRVLTFGRGTLLAAVAILAIVGALALFGLRRRTFHLPPSTFHLFLVEEAVFAFTCIAFLLIRYGNGDLWHFYMGGERPMNFAYLNAVLKSIYFPPYDPWFAGGQMNYYYFGYVLVAVPIKLLGIVPALAYNIALPMLAALTAIGAFSVAFNLAQVSDSRFNVQTFARSPAALRRGIIAGLLAVLFVVFIGNLGELKVIFDGLAELGRSDFHSTIPGLTYTVNWIRGLGQLIGGRTFPARIEWWYWNASRLMTNGEINEFPFFTFLYGDLHAHMIAFPLTLLLLGLGVGWALRRNWRSLDAWASVIVGALAVGVARANNTWDYPTYLVIAFIALLASGLQSTTRLRHTILSGALGAMLFGIAWVLGGINDLPTFAVTATIIFVADQLGHRLLERENGSRDATCYVSTYIAVMGLSILYFQPYIEHYATAYASVTPWTGPRTPLNTFILMHGILLFPIASYLIGQTHRLGWRWLTAALASSGAWREAILGLIAIALGGGIAIAALGYRAILIVGPLMGLVALLLAHRHQAAARRYVLLLVLAALAIVLAVEAVVLRGDIGRMNTVFKFYLQAWIIFGVAAAVMIGWLSQLARRWHPDTWLGWRVMLVALVMGGLTYTLFATRAKINDRFDTRLGPTLDAMEFMTVARANEQGRDYAFRDEYKALLWMQDNIQGTPVVAESASAYEYRSLRNRVAMYTGLPTLIGYEWHQRQQRSILPADVINRRLAEARELYDTLDIERAMQIIARYNIRYIMAGYPEKLYYPPDGIAKFDKMVNNGQLRVAYRNDSVTIYQVP